MEEEFVVNKAVEDPAFQLFSDPLFLFTNMFEAEVKVDEKKKKFLAYISLKGFFMPYNLVLEGHTYKSENKVTHSFIILDFAKYRDGTIRVIKESNALRTYIYMHLPLEFINKHVLKKRMMKFYHNFDEIIRVERIKRKI